MYSEIIIEAYDDGYFPLYFKGGKGITFIVGVEVKEDIRVSNISFTPVKVDMNTTSKVIMEMSKTMKGDIILLDGVTYAGFDVVDPVYIHDNTGKNVIIIQLYPLDLNRIKKALKKHFPDWYERYSIIERVYNEMFPVDTPWRTLKVHSYKLNIEEVIRVVRKTCLYSPIPEPLRIADKIASNITRIYLWRYFY